MSWNIGSIGIDSIAKQNHQQTRDICNKKQIKIKVLIDNKEKSGQKELENKSTLKTIALSLMKLT